MTDINDLYEVNDREPGEPDEYDPQPLDLEEVEQRLERLKLPDIEGWTVNSIRVTGEDAVILSELIGHDVRRLISDLRAARQRIAEWEALPTREQWAVTDGPEIQPAEGDFLPDGGHAERAFTYARQENGQAWRQKLTVHPPEPVSEDAPF